MRNVEMELKKRSIKTEERRDFFTNASDVDIANALICIETAGEDDGFPAGFGSFLDSPFGQFHPSKDVRVIVKNDCYYLNIRANHFVLLFGRSEALDNWDDCVVCLANHKGVLVVKTFKFRD